MFDRWREAIIRALNRPIFGTRVIPSDAVVDPTRFPEDKFPTCCDACGYLLRGIPDGNCPECGRPFARGRLLVMQYVIKYGWTSWRGSRSAKWARVLLVIGVTMYAIPAVAAVILILLVKTQPQPQVWSMVDFMVKVIGIANRLLLVTGLLLMLISGALALTQIRRCAAQRRALLCAIFADVDQRNIAPKESDAEVSP
ncbi:MAG: hypothetical protein V1790_01505 [Planctomycetota bacterium]